MCRNLSERAARDLIQFVRDVMAQEYNLQRRAEFTLPDHARARTLLDKHGLLTPADDPALAAVFMEEDSGPVGCTDTRPCGTCFICTTHIGAEESMERLAYGSPARMSYADAPEWKHGDRFVLDSPFGGLSTVPVLDEMPADTLFTNGTQGVVSHSEGSSASVVFDGFTGRVEVPTSWLRRV